MVLRIEITQEQWNTVNEINRENIETFFCNVISCFLEKFEDIERTILNLPNTVTKVQRYNIHRLSSFGFKSQSHGDEDDRTMEITLEKKYVQALFQEYLFESQQQPTQEPKTEKQKLFESLIGFITQNLDAEFQTYLSQF